MTNPGQRGQGGQSRGPRSNGAVIGCGCAVVLAVVVVISIVGWALSFLGGSNPIRQLSPVPDDIPPAAGEPIPSFNTEAPGRTSDQLAEWAEPISADTGIPAPALRAYANAAAIAETAWPECGLKWTTLAGLGFVETRHGTYNGTLFDSTKIDDNGVVHPPIIGVPLDGSAGFAEVRDTDNGVLDGDTVYDRAVGPLQFIPESWERYGLDANGDGVADPNQIDDAALSAAKLLCHDRDISQPEGWAEAVNSYNMSNVYLTDVRDAANSYALRQPAV